MREPVADEWRSTTPGGGSWLRLPPDVTAPAAVETGAAAAWSELLGEQPIVLIRGVERARALVLEALRLRPGSPVGLPANASHGLVEAVKRAGLRPAYLPLTADLALDATRRELDALWLQPVGGLPDGIAGGISGPVVADHGDALPRPARSSAGRGAAWVTLWGLHLEPDEQWSGAILVLTAPDNPEARELWTEIARRLNSEDRPDPGRALAQARRLEQLAERWEWAHTETTRGLEEAAGLDTLRPSRAAALSSLARYVALRVPPECDPATFFAYAAGEQTPVAWLPLVRPLYHRAIADAAGRAALAATAEHLARRLLVPVRPGDDESAISQTVLGVVKAAEYLGVRWHTRPEQAAEYAALLTECYGPDHDAYRPVFAVPRRSLSVAGVRRAGSGRT